MVSQFGQSTKLLVIAISSLAILLTAYLWLLPSFPAYSAWSYALAWVSMSLCFIGSTAISLSAMDASRPRWSNALRSLSVGLVVTLSVLAIYFVVAVKMRGS